MSTSENTSAPKVAIYWDFENIHASLHEQEVGPYKGDGRYRAQPALVDVGAIMDYARSVGGVCINRAYANWSYLHRYSDALSGHGISLVQLFPRGQHGKNGSDIQMCVDMVEDLLRLDVDVCVIVSGDSDFIGAAQKVRQYGKRVIGIGVRDFSNRYFQRVCDEFKFYDALLQSEAAAPVVVDESGKMTLKTAKQLLTAALSRLATQFGDSNVLKARIKPMMLRLEPAFDERGVCDTANPGGFPNFSAFITACHDVIEELPGDEDHRIRLRGEAAVATGQEQASPETVEKYRHLLVATVTFLLRNRDTVLMAAVKQMMLKLDPEFSEKKIGAASMRVFLERFPDLVRLHGEADRRTVELLVEKNDHGYPAPPLSPKLSDQLPDDDALHAATRFAFNDLRIKPAAAWPEFYERLKAAIEESGHQPLEKAPQQAIKKLFSDAKAFKLLPNMGGITLADQFKSEDELWDHLSKHIPDETTSA